MIMATNPGLDRKCTLPGIKSATHANSTDGSITPCESGYGTHPSAAASAASETNESGEPGRVLIDFGRSEDSEESSFGSSEKEGDFIEEKDVFDLLKLSYLLQASQLRTGELSSVPLPVQELFQELRRSLIHTRSLGQFCCSCSDTDQQEDSSDQALTGPTDTQLLKASTDCHLSSILRQALSELVQENLLQSVIPFVSTQNLATLVTGLSKGRSSPPKPAKCDSLDMLESVQNGMKDDFLDEKEDPTEREKKKSEVKIRVCDDARGAKKEFKCRQDLLLKEMGYFRDVCSGQSLDEVDISVHCDIAVFEWLVNWIEANNSMSSSKSHSTLEVTNVMSILVSASFLKMDLLVSEALRFAKDNMNKVLAVTQNFSCLGEPLITKLSLLFKPSDVEDLIDRKDKISSRLYIKLIQALMEPLPQPDREIFCSAATLFRDVTFNLNDFIKELKVELRSWRRVFWRLWGMTHTLYCCLCQNYFPVYLNEFCSFHPQDPAFHTHEFKTSSEPFGVYPCCDVPALRFQTISHCSEETNARGCQTRDHKVRFKGEQDASIFRILMATREAICLVPAKNKSGIKFSTDANSVSLPKAFARNSSQGTSIPDISSMELGQNLLHLIPHSKPTRGLLDSSAWSAAFKSLPPQPSIRKNASSASLCTSSIQSTVFMKFAARRWKNIAYGRLKRTPKVTVKAESSSSSAEDGSEDSSSSIDEDDHDGVSGAAQTANLDEDDGSEGAQKLSDKTRQQTDRLKMITTGSSCGLTVKPSMIPAASEPNLKSNQRTDINSPSSTSSSTSSSILNNLLWDNDKPTRSNQDSQRDMESMAAKAMVKHLSRNQQRVAVSSGSAASKPTSSNITSAGAYPRLEQAWRDTHMAYLQHRKVSHNTLHPSNTTSNLSRLSASGSLSNSANSLRPSSARSLRGSTYRNK